LAFDGAGHPTLLILKKDLYSFLFSIVNSRSITIVPPFVRFLMNNGMSDHVFLGSCLSVRNSSKVDTVLVSHLIVPIFRHSCSPSKFRYKVHPLRPQGSLSAILRTSWAIRRSKSGGSSTSPHDSCARLAARNSSSSRWCKALKALVSDSISSSFKIPRVEWTGYDGCM